MPETMTTLESKSFVEDTYSALASPAGLTPRVAQVELSSLIDRALTTKTPFVAEAPTGTGKTIAYLVGALSAQKKTNIPIVVATATKALQAQLLSNDLPKLFEAGVLSPSDVAIAKGKSNFLCIQNAHGALEGLSQLDLEPEVFVSETVVKGSAPEIEEILEQYETLGWDGDFDLYPKTITPATRMAIAVSGDTCIGKKCTAYKDCAFFKAKAAVLGKQLIVTNHDLLLADLLLVAEDLEPTLSVGNYYLVVDEAHHLPQKAIQVGSKEAALTKLLLSLPKLIGVQRILKASPDLKALLVADSLTEASFDKAEATFALRDVIFELMDLPIDEKTEIHRFPRGVLSDSLRAKLNGLVLALSLLRKNLDRLVTRMNAVEDLPKHVLEKAREVRNRSIDVKSLAKDCMECVEVYLNNDEFAKWFFRKEDSVILHAAPLEGAQVLRRLLWTSDRVVSTVLLSATLRDINGFTRYRKKVGAPPSIRTRVLPHTFHYENSDLVVAGMEYSPKPGDRQGFLRELKTKLPRSIRSNEGTLVLFPSWALLNELVPVLREFLGESVIRVQGELPLKVLIADHKRDIDEGLGGVLAGVATMSEGLDLPGSYCSHVVVVALPFAVPNDPVEQELSDILGPRYFSERSLPDATARLLQMVGRLIRRESDTGRITVFDNRLGATNYGRQMLQSLPPFKVAIEKVTRV
jgi:ATP-dependent DNA helicase DinG